MASASISMLKVTGNSPASDECYTPISAITPILKYIDRSKTWYEPTSKYSSSIVNAMVGDGIACNGYRGDFFNTCVHEDGIITNPPYSAKDRWIERCYEIGKPFALLLPVSSLQGQKRGDMFSKYGLDLLVLNKRVDFTGKGAPHFGVAWFTFGILPDRLIFC